MYLCMNVFQVKMMEAWGRSGISPVPTTMESSQGSLTFKFLFERFTKNFSLFFFLS